MTAEVKHIDAAHDEWFDADKQPDWIRRASLVNAWGQLWQRVAEGKRRD